MAIVRTTNKETNATGAPTKNGTAVRPAGRPLPSRQSAATRPGNSSQFIAETQTELRRVVWPTKEEVRSGTIVTVGLLIFFALYVFALDIIAERLFLALGLYGTPTP
ncbi:MAG TPA: preprotein translocase subunit SecE [Abditibacteriaceae bacterium]|jgi:preprotein translocase SecE subunit